MQTSFGACVAAWYAGIASSSMRNVAKASLLDPEVTVGSVLRSNTKISMLISHASGMARWQRGSRFNDHHHLGLAGKRECMD